MNPAEMAEGKPLAWHIRPVAPRDVPNLRSLCAALGYPVGEDQLADRLSHIMALDQHAIFIASDGEDQMLGWVHIYERPYSFKLQVQSSAGWSSMRAIADRELVRRYCAVLKSGSRREGLRCYRFDRIPLIGGHIRSTRHCITITSRLPIPIRKPSQLQPNWLNNAARPGQA